jgi:hypothetical protein
MPRHQGDERQFVVTIDGTTFSCYFNDENLFLQVDGEDNFGRGAAVYMLLSHLFANNGYSVKSANVRSDMNDNRMRFTPYDANYWQELGPKAIVNEVEVTLRQLKRIAENTDEIGNLTGFGMAVRRMYELNPTAPKEELLTQQQITQRSRMVLPDSILRTAIGISLIDSYTDHYTSNGALQLLAVSDMVMDSIRHARDEKASVSILPYEMSSDLSDHEARQAIRAGLQKGLVAAGVSDVAQVSDNVMKNVLSEIRRAKEIYASRGRSQE